MTQPSKDNKVPSIDQQLQRLRELEEKIAETAIELKRIRQSIEKAKTQKGE